MVDLTVASIPIYFGTMGAEYLWLRRQERRGESTAVGYEGRDTVASLAMGVGSLAAPIVADKLLGPLTPGKGRFGKVLPVVAVGAVVATTVADRLARLDADQRPEPGAGRVGAPPRQPSERRRRIAKWARRIARVGGPTAVAAGGAAITSLWTSSTTRGRLWDRRFVPDLGTGPIAVAVAVLGWDVIYYWNHRFMHTSRYMWAVHDVHHSSQHYNLSTALRQPVADAFGTFVPDGLLALVGIRPDVIATARAVNLLYQYWIHTEVIDRLGPLEGVLNSPSHHRVHHGSNERYLDRNHGSILITWDRLFGTFEPEDEAEPVVYGLTENIDTFNPGRIAAHEYVEISRDVARSQTWRERISFVLRGPRWAYRHRAELDGSSPDSAQALGSPAPATVVADLDPSPESPVPAS